MLLSIFLYNFFFLEYKHHDKAIFTWISFQIATLSLCLLAGCYPHSVDLIRIVGEQEVTVEMLTELDRLVQLLESPIFTFLRMELLDGDQELLNAMYGLLMLLPQSEAFRLLQNRLETSWLLKGHLRKPQPSFVCTKPLLSYYSKTYLLLGLNSFINFVICQIIVNMTFLEFLQIVIRF